LLQAEGHGNGIIDYYRSVVRTGADGPYSLLVYPGQTYIVAVTDDQWAARNLKNVTVREGEPQTELDFSLNKGTLIHGRVIGSPEKKADFPRVVTLSTKAMARWFAGQQLIVEANTRSASGQDITA